MRLSDFLSTNFGEDIARAYASFFVTACCLYIPAIWLLQYWMQDRPPYTLKWVSFTWNLTLSTLSGVGALVFLLCDPRCLLVETLQNQYYHPYVRLVIALFTLTKWIEFGDTVLLILRKKPLLFLHVYHHATVALYCWHAQRLSVDFGHHLTFINLCIHWWMYLYYAFAIVVPRHPFLRASRSYITMLQILQMFVGMWMSWTSLQKAEIQGELHFNAVCALVMYASYAYLFILFYLENYVRGLHPTMAVSLGTLYVGALTGAARLWKHHSLRWWLMTELAAEWAITVALLRQLLLSTCEATATKIMAPSVDEGRDTRPALLSTGEGTFGDSKLQAAQQRQYRSSKRGCCYSSTDQGRIVLANAETGAVLGTTTGRLGSEEQCQRKLVKLRRHQLSRTCLMLCNPWVVWALEHRILNKIAEETYAAHSAAADNPSQKQRSADTLRVLLPVFTKDLVLKSTVSLTAQQTYAEVLGSLGFCFSRSTEDRILLFAACWTAAAVGYVLHGEWLLGLLVHGCLLWIIELHTTGILVTKEIRRLKLAVE